MWYRKYLPYYGKRLSEVPNGVIDDVRAKVEALVSENPLVTVSVIAYNEETHLVSCIASLADSKCRYPMEIIGEQ